MTAVDPKPAWTRFEKSLVALCALFPLVLAAWITASSAPASHDEGLVRTAGLGWTGLFRGLDTLLAAPLMLLPVGTRAFRASLPGALVAGACGALGFVLARELANAVPALRSIRDSRLVAVTAAIAVLSVSLSPLWQMEASSPGGNVTGALLVLSALRMGQTQARATRGEAALGPLGLVCGLSVSYDFFVGLASAVAALPWLYPRARVSRISKPCIAHFAGSFVLGLFPMLLSVALLARPPELATQGTALASSLGERAPSGPAALSFVASEVGAILLVCAVAGAVIVARSAARNWLASLLGIVAVGFLASFLHARVEPWHTAAPVLAAIFAIHLLATLALAAVVSLVASARVPFAGVSAALLAVLEFVLPVRSADETLTRRGHRALHGETIWNELAWGSAPPASVILVSDPILVRRAVAARVVGQMRDDLVVVPTFALTSRFALRALREEPKLAPFYRDIALGNPPEELSLAHIAADRPLLVSFGPRWNKSFARHIVATGLLTRFEQEPRGASERRRALEGFDPLRDHLAQIAAASQNPDLAAATASLLRQRAVAAAASGERDVLSRALDDLRPFAPDDPVASALVRRMVTTKGPIDVSDLGF